MKQLRPISLSNFSQFRTNRLTALTANFILFLISGLEKIQGWIKQSLKRRLHKSLSHDWIHEKTSHKFPLRQYYVQLEWKKKIRTAMGSETVTLTCMQDLIKHLTDSESKGQMVSSLIIEGTFNISIFILSNSKVDPCYQF